MSSDVLRIFVSSPGDVGEERVMTERIVQRLQGEFGRSVRLEPILWEHEPMRATEQPQRQIPHPATCDIVVCLLWSRLGTRLPADISAEGKTATEWEFEESARSYQAKKTPDLLVYRKTIEPVTSLRDEAAYDDKRKQLQALDRFLKRWFESADGTFKAIFKTFEKLDQFEDMLERDLHSPAMSPSWRWPITSWVTRKTRLAFWKRPERPWPIRPGRRAGKHGASSPRRRPS